MENHVVPFAFDFEGHKVHTITRDGEPWWLLFEVCRVLGITNPSKAAARLEDEEKSTLTNSEAAEINGLGNPGSMPIIINESGLYSTILRSRKGAAKRFKRWVTGTVLPSIRKTGSYNALPAPAPIDIDDNEALRELLLAKVQQVISLKAEKAQLKATTAILIPKADGFDRIATCTYGSRCITDSAKALQIGPKELFTYLAQNRWIYKRAGSKYWVAYQERIAAGDLEHKTTVITNADNSERVTTQVLITPQGLAKLARVFGRLPPVNRELPL